MFRPVAILALCCAFAASSSVAQTADATFIVNGTKVSVHVAPVEPAPVEPSYGSLWEFGGSQMGLRSEGNARSFYYTQPHSKLAELGVRPGQLQFDGRREGGNYIGTARGFHPNCGTIPYDVTGFVAPDDRSVTLVGWAPVLTAECVVVGSKRIVNVYNLQ